jgi:hypothetical protein
VTGSAAGSGQQHDVQDRLPLRIELPDGEVQ